MMLSGVCAPGNSGVDYSALLGPTAWLHDCAHRVRYRATV